MRADASEKTAHRAREPELPDYQKNTIAQFFSYLHVDARRILEIGSDHNLGVVNAIAREFDGLVTGINPAKNFPNPHTFRKTNVFPIRADGQTIPFGNETIDAIVSVATLEHTTDVAALLEECHRVLRPDGFFYTFFGPIWSCAVGHHVFARVENKEARFWKPGRNPLPDFSHLLMTEEEMRHFLHGGPCDDRLIEPILQHVYHSSQLNRLSYEEYLGIFEQSQFCVDMFVGRERSLNLPPCLETKVALADRYGEDKNFMISSIEALCFKSPLTSTAREPFLRRRKNIQGTLKRMESDSLAVKLRTFLSRRSLKPLGRIAVYGIDAYGSVVYDQLIKADALIAGIVDGRPELSGWWIDDHQIEPYSALAESKPDTVMVCSFTHAGRMAQNARTILGEAVRILTVEQMLDAQG